jgi:hypothetical protein
MLRMATCQLDVVLLAMERHEEQVMRSLADAVATEEWLHYAVLLNILVLMYGNRCGRV